MSDEDRKYVLPAEYETEIYPNTQDTIVIRQESPMGEEALIVLSVERVDRFIEFLRAVKDDILTARADEAARVAAGSPPIRNG